MLSAPCALPPSSVGDTATLHSQRHGPPPHCVVLVWWEQKGQVLLQLPVAAEANAVANPLDDELVPAEAARCTVRQSTHLQSSSFPSVQSLLMTWTYGLLMT